MGGAAQFLGGVVGMLALLLPLAAPAGAQDRETVRVNIALRLVGDAPPGETHTLTFRIDDGAPVTSRFCSPDLPPHRPACLALFEGVTYPTSIRAAPGARIAFRPGGHHLMLVDLKRPLKQGERFAGALLFERAGRVPVTFEVRGLGAGAGHGAHTAH